MMNPTSIEQDLRLGGFLTEAKLETVASRSHAASGRIPAIAYCQGTPLRNEIEAVGPNALSGATDVCTAAMTEKFGPGPINGKIQAHIVTIAA